MIHLSEAAKEYLNIRDQKSLMDYYDRHKGKTTQNDHSSVDSYIKYCALEDLAKYINHPSSRVSVIIKSRLSGEG